MASQAAAVVRAAAVLHVPSNVTVNGRPLREYLAVEKNREIDEFLSKELSGLRRMIYR